MRRKTVGSAEDAESKKHNKNFFEKTSKKGLTNKFGCDIIIESLLDRANTTAS